MYHKKKGNSKKGSCETSNKASRKQTTPQKPKTSGLTGKGYKS